MKDGDQKKIIRKSVAKVLKEMCGKGHKRDPHRDIEIYEDAYDLYTREPEEPDNPEYMRGWEDGYEAGKIGAAMYGEAKRNFPGNEISLEEENPRDGSDGEWGDIPLQESIEKRGDKWAVVSKDGSETLGTHNTKEDAVDQLQAIEANK